MSAIHKPVEINAVIASRIVVKFNNIDTVFDVRGHKHIRDTLGYEVGLIRDFYDEGFASPKWFIFTTANCADPCLTLIRADSFEEAREIYCDECEEMIKIDDADIADYDADGVYYNSNGTALDTDPIQCWNVELLRIEP